MMILRSVVRSYVYSSANLLVARNNFCVVKFVKCPSFIVRMVNSPTRCKMRVMLTTNKLFLSSLVPLFQSESKFETIFYENDFDLHEIETACRTHVHMKGFALRLVLKQRHKRTQNWPIKTNFYYVNQNLKHYKILFMNKFLESF